MTTPLEIITKHLDAEYQREVDKETKERKHWRASSAGYCMRKVFLERKGITPTNPIDARTKRVFDVGNIFHRWAQDIVAQYGEGHAERRIEIPDLDVVGHCDNILKNDGGWLLVDYKTQHSRAFWHGTKNGGMLKPHQRLQVGTYLYGLQKEFPGINGAIVFISKDDLAMEQAAVLWDDELLNDVLNYWGTLNGAWKRNILPPCTCEWELKFCAYKDGDTCCSEHLWTP